MPFATINDIEMHFIIEGQGCPLVLLHGLGSCAEDWEDQLPVLAAHFRVIVPSLRGFGKTDKPPGPYSIAQYAADVSAFLDYLEVGRCHMLGFSMGGAIGFQLAVDEPKRLLSLIIVNSLPSFELDHWRKQLMVLTRVGMAKIMGMERMVRFISKRVFPEPHQKALRDKTIARHGKNNRDSYLAAVNALAGWTVEDDLAKVTMPVLMVAADQDYSTMQEKHAVVEALPDARLAVIENSRHVSYIDQPELFSQIVLEFLRAQPAC